MKIAILINARKTIKNHWNETIPFSIGYKMMKFLKESETEEKFYNEKLSALIEECAQKDDNGKYVSGANGGIVLKQEAQDKWRKVIKELDETEIEQPKIKFKLEDLKSINFTIGEIYSLDDFIEEN